MDQHLIAGIGNIYSDEILYAAGLRYDRMTDTLTTQDIRRLYRAVVEVVHEAVKHRGSSLADEQYRRPVRARRRLPERAPGLRPRGSRVPALPIDDRAREVPGSIDLLLPQLSGLTPRPLPAAALAPLASLTGVARRAVLQPLRAGRVR